MKKIDGEYIVGITALMIGAFCSGGIIGYFKLDGFKEWIIKWSIPISFMYISLFLYSLIKKTKNHNN